MPQRTCYHPFVPEYQICADAAARIKPKMATVTLDRGHPYHDGFIANGVPTASSGWQWESLHALVALKNRQD